MDLSIIIPVFNESKKIAVDIEAAGEFLKTNELSGEIIVADDGSDDGTADVAEGCRKDLGENVELKVIRCGEHRGKGFAVRLGITKSSGEYAMFADSGCCVPYSNALNGLELIKTGVCEIAHGSRKLAKSNIEQQQNRYRRICSGVFQQFVKWFMGIPAELTDTQCGFKIYRGKVARDLYSRCVTNGFMFDIEVILRAVKQGYKIKEFPIQWRCDSDSRLKPMRSLRRIIGELISIKQVV